MWLRLTLPASNALRLASADYLREYNREYKTSFSVSFPKPYRMVIKEGRRSARRTGSRGAKDPENDRDLVR